MTDYQAARMFPDTVDIAYRVTGLKDPTSGPLASYRPGPTAVPCARQDGAAVAADGMRVVGEAIDSAVWFRADAPTGPAVAALKRGDLLTFPGPVVQEVVRADAMGIGDLQLWQVYTRRRE